VAAVHLREKKREDWIEPWGPRIGEGEPTPSSSLPPSWRRWGSIRCREGGEGERGPSCIGGESSKPRQYSLFSLATRRKKGKGGGAATSSPFLLEKKNLSAACRSKRRKTQARYREARRDLDRACGREGRRDREKFTS